MTVVIGIIVERNHTAYVSRENDRHSHRMTHGFGQAVLSVMVRKTLGFMQNESGKI